MQNHPYVIVTNIIFGALTMFHLAYLGLMFDSSADSEEVILKELLILVRNIIDFEPSVTKTKIHIAH
jgi:hypothetical protein